MYQGRYIGYNTENNLIQEKYKYNLKFSEKELNRNFSNDRIIAENYLGRLCGLWMGFHQKFEWSKTLYDEVFLLYI